MTVRSVQCVCWLSVLLLPAVLTGCTRRERVALPTIGSAWEARVNADQKVGPTNEVGRTTRGDERGHAIATVNGQPIARNRLVDFLLRSHGVNLLEQLVALEAAQGLAEEKGLHVDAADLDREYDRALRRLLDPLLSITSDTFDRQQAERLLDTILADRNMLREEFLIVIRRNAYLRAVVESQQVLTEQQLRTEYERAFGERVQIRHIQLATPAEVSRITDRLDAGGDFGELARHYSANAASARLGGLLEPFAAHDDEVPELLREVAFALGPGEVSGALRIGSWYQLLKLEQRIPAEDRDFAQVRGELERRARERLADPAMEQLYERLFREASIQIHDPVLREAFEMKHANLGSMPKP